MVFILIAEFAEEVMRGNHIPIRIQLRVSRIETHVAQIAYITVAHIVHAYPCKSRKIIGNLIGGSHLETEDHLLSANIAVQRILIGRDSRFRNQQRQHCHLRFERTKSLIEGSFSTAARKSEASGKRPVAFSIRDRKSTRLNSSHANISYAVFCLKNKP